MKYLIFSLLTVASCSNNVEPISKPKNGTKYSIVVTTKIDWDKNKVINTYKKVESTPIPTDNWHLQILNYKE